MASFPGGVSASAADRPRSPGGCRSVTRLLGSPVPAQGSSGPGSHAGRGMEEIFPDWFFPQR